MTSPLPVRAGSILVAACAAYCGASRADQIQTQPTVQVTASRVAETVDEALADVSVITREDIDASASRDVLDLLRLEAGIDLYRTGGAGQQTSLFLRGTNVNQVLVLIDGVRMAAATTGAYAFEQLPLDAVERIEVVRGPRASYWGSDALGGVIQIFTRRLDGPRATLGYGSHGDAAGSIGIGQWRGDEGYSVQVGARNVDGYSATHPGICNGPDDPFCSYDPDDDGFRKTHLTARAAQRFGSQLVAGSFLRSQGRSQFDQGESDIIQQVAGLEIGGELAANWSHRLAFGHNREDLQTPAFGAHYRTRRQSLLWQNEVRVDDAQRLVAGVDFVREQAESLDTFAGTPRYRDERDTRAVFAGWRASWGAFESEVAVRHDDDSAFGGADTGSLALAWRANERLRLRANVGLGFRSPSMNDLYDPGYGGWFAGNPDLDPERSRSSELGLQWQATELQQFGLSLYSTRVRDLISFTGHQNQAENIAHAAIDGAELSWRLDAGAWNLDANWTWQDARDDDTGERLLRRARHKGSLVAERAVGTRLRVGAELHHVGRRDDVGDVRLGAFTLLNLRASWTLADAWSLGARLENLADRDYALVHGYNTPGRAGYLELRWQP